MVEGMMRGMENIDHGAAPQPLQSAFFGRMTGFAFGLYFALI